MLAVFARLMPTRSMRTTADISDLMDEDIEVSETVVLSDLWFDPQVPPTPLRPTLVCRIAYNLTCYVDLVTENGVIRVGESDNFLSAIDNAIDNILSDNLTPIFTLALCDIVAPVGLVKAAYNHLNDKLLTQLGTP